MDIHHYQIKIQHHQDHILNYLTINLIQLIHLQYINIK